MNTSDFSSSEWIYCQAAREALHVSLASFSPEKTAIMLCDIGEGLGAERKDFKGRDGTLYLTRYTLVEDRGILGGPKEGHAYLHRLHRADLDPVPHDHPWDMTVVRLLGTYVEHSHLPGGPTVRNVYPGSVYHMDHRQFHRIHELLDKEVWSLVLTGPYRHSWGFLCPSDDKGAPGRKVPHAAYRPDHANPSRSDAPRTPSYGR